MEKGTNVGNQYENGGPSSPPMSEVGGNANSAYNDELCGYYALANLHVARRLL